MKIIHTLIIFAIALFCLFGCKDSNDPEPDGKKNDLTQKNENIASTNIISKDFNLKNFTGITLDMDGDLVLATGEDEDFSITIEGPDNVVESIDVNIISENHISEMQKVLTFSSDSTFTGEYNVTFHVSMPSVAYISMKQKGSLTNKKKSTTVGRDNLYGRSEILIEIDGEALVDLDIVSINLETIISGTAEVYYSGSKTSGHYIQNYGDLTLHGFTLKAFDTEFVTSHNSVLDCEISARQLTVEGSGSGTIRYKGSPEMFTDDLTGDIELIDLGD